MKKIAIVIVVIVLILNLTPISYLLKEDYSYSNADGSYTFNEEGGAGFNFDMAKQRYKWFLQEHPEKLKEDTKLYRTFTIKPWRVWQWWDYAFQHDRFSLPYKDPDKHKNPR